MRLLKVGQVIAHVLLAFTSSQIMLAAESSAQFVSRTLPLTSIVDCSLRTKWIGIWPLMPQGVMLTCQQSEFLVLQPNNLVGHVRIDTPHDALEYVRFFTSPDTYEFFDLEGMVEVIEGDPAAADATFNVVSPGLFRKHFTRAAVRKVGDHPCKQGVTLACGNEYEIKRVVVLADQRVYEVVETVFESGFYALNSKRILLKDAAKVGILHLGNL